MTCIKTSSQCESGDHGKCPDSKSLLTHENDDLCLCSCHNEPEETWEDFIAWLKKKRELEEKAAKSKIRYS